jgi:NAD(P)-dependent dehydrogenase (short-subunit alcohol dehydrogenase family)
VGKHVVVTGASSGIGRALSRAWGREGATVWMGARSEKALEEAAREVDRAGGHGHALPLDVTQRDSIQRFGQAVAAQAPGVDVLVNNAGVGHWGAMDATDAATWDRVIATNLTGPFLVTKAMLPLLRKRAGPRHVVNLVSVAGKQAHAGGSTYSASKFGLKGWTEAIAAELAEEGIRVVAVCPGYVNTDLVAGSGAEAERMIQPDDLAQVILDWTFLPASVAVDEITVWPWEMYTE